MKTSISIVNSALQKKNKKNRKGFSLVELIVVLVIMAILAAALVPTMIGYIQQTRQSTVKNDAASAVQAAQTIGSAAFADTNYKYNHNGTGEVSGTGSVTFTVSNGTVTVDDMTTLKADIADLAEVDVENIDSVTYTSNFVVETLSYHEDSTYVYYNNGTYGVGSSEADAESDAGGA